METFRLIPGSTRLLVSIPHAGTFVLPEISARMTGAARALPDTDWHVDRLYDFLEDIGASVLVATHSRYVVDLNRPPDDTALYPGLTGSGICPVETFDGQPVWRARQAPGPAEAADRIAQYWQPYHAALRAELDALLDRHGSAVLWDAHSIRSHVPRLFAGDLPVFNLGTNDGLSCDEGLAARLLGYALGIPGCTAVLDGRFKGGYITRHYGQPQRGISAVQMEMAQACYLDEADPERFDPALAAPAQAVLRALLEAAVAAL